MPKWAHTALRSAVALCGSREPWARHWAVKALWRLARLFASNAQAGELLKHAPPAFFASPALGWEQATFQRLSAHPLHAASHAALLEVSAASAHYWLTSA